MLGEAGKVAAVAVTCEAISVTRRFSPKKLSKLLNERGWNAARLAGELGIREQTVTNWLAGDNRPSLDAFLDMVDKLKVSEADLLDRIS